MKYQPTLESIDKVQKPDMTMQYSDHNSPNKSTVKIARPLKQPLMPNTVHNSIKSK